MLYSYMSLTLIWYMFGVRSNVTLKLITGRSPLPSEWLKWRHCCYFHIGSGVSESHGSEIDPTPLTWHIALATVYALTCCTVIPSTPFFWLIQLSGWTKRSHSEDTALLHGAIYFHASPCSACLSWRRAADRTPAGRMIAFGSARFAEYHGNELACLATSHKAREWCATDMTALFSAALRLYAWQINGKWHIDLLLHGSNRMTRR